MKDELNMAKNIDILTDGICSVLDGMSNALTKENVKLYKSIVKESPLEKITDYEEFHATFICPFANFAKGFIKTEISINDDIEFILLHSQFIDSHFSALFAKIEGMACCADKSRTVIESLLDYFFTDKVIKFDYDQEYTFHLPNEIMTTHDDIMRWYTALKNLYYGFPDLYLKALYSLVERK